MRRSILTAATFACTALAAPQLVKRDCNDTCMTYDQATQVANNFKTLISAYSTDAANQYLTADYTDYSDSVTTLIDSGCQGPQTLGDATFSTRAAFEAGQGSQPDIPFEILNLWYACTGPVVVRWRTALHPEFVTGNIVMETEHSGDGAEPWLIKTVYSEFNSGAWLVDLGVFKPNCSADGDSTAAHKVKRGLPANIM
ncbi:hypothetical protein Tdes44962_MAKER08369 [Teratosphaeria destructans]|uniref:NTF2-like domain-containing protein n=1 Tax=Teratosphaeria destructans TaxID=418781 RepID=A0A9W7W519_9PEZI|nr:hypothetical protein Tdes44962_MAKER08369 [Teratosphaeria destructans]